MVDYHQDRLGSVRALTTASSSPAVVNTYTYDAYGKTLSASETVANPFRYTGEYTDAESGFIYLRARYYDPETQQFLTVDPALAWTEQAYAYVGGSPTNFVDPLGLYFDRPGDSRPKRPQTTGSGWGLRGGSGGGGGGADHGCLIAIGGYCYSDEGAEWQIRYCTDFALPGDPKCEKLGQQARDYLNAVAAGFITPGGRVLTDHCQESLPRHGFKPPYSAVDAILDSATRTTPQRDGAEVFIKVINRGKQRLYSFAIVTKDKFGNQVIVTAVKGQTKAQMENFGRRYGFDPFWP